MNKYTIYCTSEQTKRANELGAPLEKASLEPWKNKIPTIEQMCGWLRDKYNIHIYALQCVDLTYIPQVNICNNGVINQLFDWGYEEYFDSYQQAMHVAIDTALKYLEKECGIDCDVDDLISKKDINK